MARRPPRGDRPFRPSSRDFDAPKPVKEGEEIDISIEAIGTKGDGIARVQGFIVFVPNTKVGDRLKVKVTSVRPNFAMAEAVGAAGGAAATEAEEEEEEEEE